jgi:hypothetical protein
MIKKQKQANVVPFAGKEEPETCPSHDEIVEMLVGMDDIEFEHWRIFFNAKWPHIRMEALDRLRKRALHLRRYREKPQRPEPEPSELEEKIGHILKTEGILDLWIQSWDKVMAGEPRTLKTKPGCCRSKWTTARIRPGAS